MKSRTDLKMCFPTRVLTVALAFVVISSTFSIKNAYAEGSHAYRPSYTWSDDNYDWVRRGGEIAIGNAARDTAIGMALGSFGPIYSLGTATNTMWKISQAETADDFYRATRGTPAFHLGAAVKILDNIEIPQVNVYQNTTPTYSSDWSDLAVTTEKTIHLDENNLIRYQAIDWNATLQNMRDNSILTNSVAYDNLTRDSIVTNSVAYDEYIRSSETKLMRDAHTPFSSREEFDQFHAPDLSNYHYMLNELEPIQPPSFDDYRDIIRNMELEQLNYIQSLSSQHTTIDYINPAQTILDTFQPSSFYNYTQLGIDIHDNIYRLELPQAPDWSQLQNMSTIDTQHFNDYLDTTHLMESQHLIDLTNLRNIEIPRSIDYIQPIPIEPIHIEPIRMPDF